SPGASAPNGAANGDGDLAEPVARFDGGGASGPEPAESKVGWLGPALTIGGVGGAPLGGSSARGASQPRAVETSDERSGDGDGDGVGVGTGGNAAAAGDAAAIPTGGTSKPSARARAAASSSGLS